MHRKQYHAFQSAWWTALIESMFCLLLTNVSQNRTFRMLWRKLMLSKGKFCSRWKSHALFLPTKKFALIHLIDVWLSAISTLRLSGVGTTTFAALLFAQSTACRRNDTSRALWAAQCHPTWFRISHVSKNLLSAGTILIINFEISTWVV